MKNNKNFLPKTQDLYETLTKLLQKLEKEIILIRMYHDKPKLDIKYQHNIYNN